ncbi:MAG: hypothetical protein ACI8RD_012038 [Bacillariaceae sp.]|jgi:hypothetical protein
MEPCHTVLVEGQPHTSNDQQTTNDRLILNQSKNDRHRISTSDVSLKSFTNHSIDWHFFLTKDTKL